MEKRVEAQVVAYFVDGEVLGPVELAVGESVLLLRTGTGGSAGNSPPTPAQSTAAYEEVADLVARAEEVLVTNVLLVLVGREHRQGLWQTKRGPTLVSAREGFKLGTRLGRAERV